MSVESDPIYLQSTQILLGQMERSWHIARRSVPLAVLTFFNRWGLGVGALIGSLTFLASYIYFAFSSPKDQHAFIIMLMSCLSILSAVGVVYVCSIQSFWQRVLGVFGRAFPLVKSQSTQINSWIIQYPAMVETLGRWGAHNPDAILNYADFLALKRWVARLEKVHKSVSARIDNEKLQQANQELLITSGVMSAIHKARLEKVSRQSRSQIKVDDVNESAKPPLM